MATFQEIKNSLPDMPDEVVNAWLVPISQDMDWPPDERQLRNLHYGWTTLLRCRGLAFWRAVRWRLVEWEIDFARIDPISRADLAMLGDRLFRGDDDPNLNITATITDSPERSARIRAHLEAHGTLPGAIVLCRDPAGLTVLDGNHRLATYFEYWNLYRRALRSGQANGAKPSDYCDAWLAEPP